MKKTIQSSTLSACICQSWETKSMCKHNSHILSRWSIDAETVQVSWMSESSCMTYCLETSCAVFFALVSIASTKLRFCIYLTFFVLVTETTRIFSCLLPHSPNLLRTCPRSCRCYWDIYHKQCADPKFCSKSTIVDTCRWPRTVVNSAVFYDDADTMWRPSARATKESDDVVVECANSCTETIDQAW